jgi:Zn-dependent protease with chaperone function
MKKFERSLTQTMFSLHAVLAAVVVSTPVNLQAQDTENHISVVTPYDIMTAEDEFYYHHIYKLTDDADVSNWPLVKSLLGLGGNFLDAKDLARLANQSIKINEQSRATKIMDMVKECSRIIGVDPPAVFIHGLGEPNAYVTNLTHPHVLVLTGGLVELFQDNPEELKFIIGHELGHIKAQHIRTHFVGRLLYRSMLGRTAAEAGSVTDLISVGTAGVLLHWYRESEYTADRAGLLCVKGDLNVAQQALLRLLHKTRQINKLMVGEEENFSAQLARQDQAELRNRPFVHIFSFVTEFQSTHPFVPQRCEQLAQWRGSDEYAEISSRSALSKTAVFIEKIEIERLPDTEISIPLIDGPKPDAFLELAYAQERMHTACIPNESSPRWIAPKLNFASVDGAGLIIDVFDKNSVTSNSLIGSIRFDIETQKPGEYEIESDLRLDVLKESTVVDRPKVRVSYRVVANQP